MEGMMKKDPQHQMRIGHVLHPILAPGISGEVIGPGGETTYETTSLGFGFSFEGGLISVFAECGVDVDGVFHDGIVFVFVVVVAVSGFGEGGGAVVVVAVVVDATAVVIVSRGGGRLVEVGGMGSIVSTARAPTTAMMMGVIRPFFGCVPSSVTPGIVVVIPPSLHLVETDPTNLLDGDPPSALLVFAIPHAGPHADVGLIGQQYVGMLDAAFLELIDRRRGGGGAIGVVGGGFARVEVLRELLRRRRRGGGGGGGGVTERNDVDIPERGGDTDTDSAATTVRRRPVLPPKSSRLEAGEGKSRSW
mmetsp:Transcript_6634/g.13159  ORF Transcript_6634/g.13159 Transcript_6634/m.13159 type:complete len:305 (+) Transcript_6634:849-1763(+)